MTRTALDHALASLPSRYVGPGGAVAVIRDGEVLARHAWGWADAERRIPFTPLTMSLICSITKQFTCGLLLDQFPDPTVLNDDFRRRLPALAEGAPTILDLAHNQSGLRDYWAVAMLYGAPVEGVFDMPRMPTASSAARRACISRPAPATPTATRISASSPTSSSSEPARVSAISSAAGSSTSPPCPMPG